MPTHKDKGGAPPVRSIYDEVASPGLGSTPLTSRRPVSNSPEAAKRDWDLQVINNHIFLHWQCCRISIEEKSTVMRNGRALFNYHWVPALQERGTLNHRMTYFYAFWGWGVRNPKDLIYGHMWNKWNKCLNKGKHIFLL